MGMTNDIYIRQVYNIEYIFRCTVYTEKYVHRYTFVVT